MTTYTTDVDGMVSSWGALAERLGAAGVRPACTLVGVTRLFSPDLMVQIAVTAVDWTAAEAEARSQWPQVRSRPTATAPAQR